MRVKVTTEIDINLKMMFEACKEQHRTSYKELLELGISELLKKYDPVGTLQADIEREDRAQAERREQLARLRLLSPTQKRIREYEDENVVRQTVIQQWFEKDPEHILDGVKKGWLNYAKLAERFDFSSPAECKRWVLQVVAKWKEAHET